MGNVLFAEPIASRERDALRSSTGACVRGRELQPEVKTITAAHAHEKTMRAVSLLSACKEKGN